jgi:hypothetical protein
MPAGKDVQREWARRGALLRLNEIEQERVSILAIFPELRRRGVAESGGQSSAPTRRMSAAARLKHSKQMKKYWNDPKNRSKRKLTPEVKKRMSAGMKAYWAKRKGESRVSA